MKPSKPLSERQLRRAETALFDTVAGLQDTAECRAFFKDLCTPAELQALVDRWQVVAYLQKDLPYRRINELTGVSVTTIGRVARCLVDGHGGYQAALQRQSRSSTSPSSH